VWQVAGYLAELVQGCGNASAITVGVVHIHELVCILMSVAGGWLPG